MHLTRSVLTAFLATALITGCGKKDASSSDKPGSGSGDTGSGAPGKPAKPTAPITAEFFGKTVAPPGDLAKLSIGMAEADARAAAPALFPKPKGDYQLSDGPFVGVNFGVGLNKDSKKVSRLTISLPPAANAKAMLESAWGKGKDAKDSIDKPRTYWFDPATGWRAHLEQGFGDDMSLEFDKYLPVTALLGEGPDTIGFAPQGILGATVDELRTRFPTTIVETDAAKAAADQKKVGDFAGKDVAKELGEAKPSVRLDLLPTEWESYWTRIQIDFTDDKKVEDVWFDIPYEAYGPAKDELKALLEKKWGTPTEGKDLGDTIWIYRAAAPSVVVEDDTISKAWNVRISAKAHETEK
ncbi:MAG: hypothetical protein K8W52_33875 [Deltaproteobacteria bacterium]|nr:hypothetical protein [Deltaproteobacteria bacterium]